MNSKFRKWRQEDGKYLAILWLLVLITSFAMFLPSVMRGQVLTYGTDIESQGFPFYEEFRKLVFQSFRNHTLPFYSWDLFLGNNFWASKTYYLIGDIYAWIGLLFKTDYFDLMRNLSVVKYLAGATGFYYLLRCSRHPQSTSLIVSYAYAFSAWAVFFSGQIVFLSFYSLVPFYLLGIEKWIREKKWVLFACMCALMFSCSWYFFYILSLFTILWYIYRYLSLNHTWKGLFSSALKLIGFYLIGISITAFVWLPGIIYILGSDRFARSYGIFYQLIVYLNRIFARLVPSYMYTYRIDIFDTGVHSTREICRYVSVFLAVLIPQKIYLERKKSKGFKYLTLAIYLLINIFAFFPSLDRTLQGFSDAGFRWFFMAVCFDLFTCADVLDHLKELNLSLLNKTAVLYPLAATAAFLSAVFIRHKQFSDYFIQFSFILLYGGLGLLSLWIYQKRNRKILLAAIALETSICTSYVFLGDAQAGTDEKYSNINAVTHVLADHEGDFTNMLDSLSPENSSQYYRVYIDQNAGYWDYSYNMSVFYNINGLSTYDSSVAPSFHAMSEIFPQVHPVSDADWYINIEDSELMNFLNVKYAVLRAGTSMKSGNWKLVSSGYRQGFDIYENLNYRPLLTAYSSAEDLESLRKNPDTERLLDTVFADPEDTDPAEIKASVSDADLSIHDVSYYSNQMHLSYTSNQSGYTVMTLPYDKGWKILVDGAEVSYDNVNCGFIGLKVQKGTHQIDMYFVPQGFHTGIILSAGGILVMITALLISRKKRPFHHS